MEAMKKEKNKVVLSSCKELTRVKPGWYWYEDGSFSPVLISEKKLKAVVVLVEYSIIYGDVFIEKMCQIKETKAFLKESQSKLRGKVYLPTLREHNIIGENINDINASLSRVGKVPLWEGSYMTGTECSYYHVWIKAHPEGTCFISEKKGKYKVRPLIYLSIN